MKSSHCLGVRLTLGRSALCDYVRGRLRDNEKAVEGGTKTYQDEVTPSIVYFYVHRGFGETLDPFIHIRVE